MPVDVLLVALPWAPIESPSIALGTLKGVLDRSGISSRVLYLSLTWMEHLAASRERYGIQDYRQIALAPDGIGEWIFAVPPYQDLRGDEDERYFEHLRAAGFGWDEIARAIAMRALVPAFLARAVDEILAAQPRIVGFTSTFSQNLAALATSRLLKTRAPSLRVVFGGANCDGPMGAALHRAFPWIDAVVRGEGEPVLPSLVRDLLAGGPIKPQPGLCYRDGERSIAVAQTGSTMAMDDVPLPHYDDYFARLDGMALRDQLRPRVIVHFEASRGCWWGEISHCTFCGLNGSTMAFRSKRPERVVDEIVALATRHRQLDFDAVDNIIDLDYFATLLPQLRALGLDLRVFVETKANLKRAQVKALRDAGIRRIQPGIESLSTPILRLMGKGVTALHNLRLLKWCARYGVTVEWNLLYGFPGEPADEYARMAALIPSLHHLRAPIVGEIEMERFSPYFQRPGDFGLENLGPLPQYRFLYRAVDDATRADIAYAFSHRHSDGRDPKTYLAPLKEALRLWAEVAPQNRGALRYRRGPGFLRIQDRRSEAAAADYVLEGDEARIYLACDGGATPEGIARRLARGAKDDLSAGEIRRFLDDLTAARLAFEERGRYLSLALPENPDEDDAATAPEEETEEAHPGAVIPVFPAPAGAELIGTATLTRAGSLK
ncbi:MAG: RiPP maturation radical SAM protein 1 [Myxococcales bacterium]|nr:RiPP maturation radical SAM protein 1 [Myxococcales bacterium]